MKQVLSLLTAFVFLQMQTWALSGGPVFGPAASPNFAGVYSGVMVAQFTSFGLEGSGTTPNQSSPAGNIGMYTVSVPATGIANGTSVLFINGTIFTGTLQGVADPDKKTFDGILNLTSSLIITFPDGTTSTPTAQGQMRTKIIENTKKPLPGRPDLTTGVAARMEGKAVMDASAFVNANLTPLPLVQTKYSVSGYRQSTLTLP